MYVVVDVVAIRVFCYEEYGFDVVWVEYDCVGLCVVVYCYCECEDELLEV